MSDDNCPGCGASVERHPNGKPCPPRGKLCACPFCEGCGDEDGDALRALLRRVVGELPDRWGYRAAGNVFDDKLRAEIRAAVGIV